MNSIVLTVCFNFDSSPSECIAMVSQLPFQGLDSASGLYLFAQHLLALVYCSDGAFGSFGTLLKVGFRQLHNLVDLLGGVDEIPGA